MKILHIISGLGSGGTEGVLYRLLETENRKDFTSCVVSLTDRGIWADKIEALGVNVQVISMPKGLPSFGFRRKLKVLVQNFEPDIILGWLYRGNLAALWAGENAKKVPVVWNIRHSLHDWKKEKFFFKLTVRANKWLSKKPDLVVFNSKVSQEQHKDFGFNCRESLVIPNGFNIEKFKPDAGVRKKYRSQWGASESTWVIGLIARWHGTKNHLGFIAAAKIILQSRTDIIFVLAGQGVDSLNSVLIQAIKGTEKAENFRLLGRIDDVSGVTASLDVGVNASFGEAFPNAVGEAMACAVPCVATDVGDSAWIVGSTGVVVSPEPEDLARGMEKFLTQGKAWAIDHGQQAQLRVKELFDLKLMSQSYKNVYMRGYPRGRS